jgi:ribosome-associated toxin RatA of RatAB toxin-antitoxin module
MTPDLTPSNELVAHSALAEDENLNTANIQEMPISDDDGAIADQIAVSSEVLEGRKRRIVAQTELPYALENIWHILTDYDHLADFIPSLKASRRVEHPENGIRVEQIGSQSLLKVKFCARVVLDMVETFPQRIDFTMVEGDFKEFQGAWLLQPTAVGSTPSTHVEYTLDVLPSRLMPVNLIERKLSHNLKVNLFSIHQRAIALFGCSTEP